MMKRPAQLGWALLRSATLFFMSATLELNSGYWSSGQYTCTGGGNQWYWVLLNRLTPGKERSPDILPAADTAASQL